MTKILITSYLPNHQNRIAAAFLKSFRPDLEIYISGNDCNYENSSHIQRLMEESYLLKTFEQIVFLPTSRNKDFTHYIFISESHKLSNIEKEYLSANSKTIEIKLPVKQAVSVESYPEDDRLLRDTLKNEIFIFFNSFLNCKL